MTFSKKMKFFDVDYDMIDGISCLALPINARTQYINCILCMNSVSGLCLCLRDTALKLTRHWNCVNG